MKKILLSLVLLVGSAGFVFVTRANTNAQAIPALDTVATQTSSDATPTETTSSVPATNPVATTPAPVVAPTPAPRATGQYVDGTYTGSVADAYYGNIQVAAVISGGKLTNIKVLQYPNDRGTSIEINRQALPMLIEEAISAQSSSVDGISGASDTSAAFVQSLHTALLKAKA